MFANLPPVAYGRPLLEPSSPRPVGLALALSSMGYLVLNSRQIRDTGLIISTPKDGGYLPAAVLPHMKTK